MGGGGIYEPTYEGGDEFEVSPVPFVVFTWGDWLEIDPRGITVTALEQNGFSIAGKVGYETDRDEKDDDRLRGIRPGVNGGNSSLRRYDRLATHYPSAARALHRKSDLHSHVFTLPSAGQPCFYVL